MAELHQLFVINRPLLLFVYGQTFFVLGLAIFLQSRKHSRLRLARDLRWLASFGVLHGIYERARRVWNGNVDRRPIEVH